ncbi:MAG TPA: ABC transporter ATP-binding protein, partial [Methanocorpusculum sp.]|nr:ABC transporter ATP-binding protein [Methanocorpusculum sp.]
FCHLSDITLEYTHGVVDKCLLSVMSGEDTLIMTSGGMLDRVELRAAAFAKESGIGVKVIRV